MVSFIFPFVFWYPLIMSMVWMVGGIIFYFRIEHKDSQNPPNLDEEPLVSIIIPCYNEQETIEETIQNTQLLKYKNFEIVAINDGSKDNTSTILKALSKRFKNLRIIDLKENAGKANALYLGFIASKGEILLGLDADAYLDPYALHYMIPHFTTPNNGERVAAVTGNPRVRNRSSLLAKIQVCEFSSIIGLIKRTQRILGKIMTVSGVMVAYRKRALLDCGLWERDIVTEDIAVTWKLQKRFWDIRYEPRAICHMLVPETIVGIWKQRVRWAQGGIEVLLRHWNVLFDWKYRRIVPIYLEQILSIVWSISWFTISFIEIIQWIIGYKSSFPIQWQGAYISIFCICQFLITMWIDRRYDEKLLRYSLWTIWYPIFYWYINVFAILWAIPKAIFRKRNVFAVWESPDRGLSA